MPVIKCDSVFKIFGVNAEKLLQSSNGNVDAKAFQDAGCVVGVNNASFEAVSYTHLTLPTILLV